MNRRCEVTQKLSEHPPLALVKHGLLSSKKPLRDLDMCFQVKTKKTDGHSSLKRVYAFNQDACLCWVSLEFFWRPRSQSPLDDTLNLQFHIEKTDHTLWTLRLRFECQNITKKPTVIQRFTLVSHPLQRCSQSLLPGWRLWELIVLGFPVQHTRDIIMVNSLGPND